MKKLALLLFAAGLCFTSCKKENEEEAVPCEFYMTGEDCKTEIRTLLVGNYEGMAKDGNLQEPFNFELKVYSSNPKILSIAEYYTIELKSATEFVFAEALQGGGEFSGSGTIVNGKMTFVMEQYFEDTNETKVFSYEGNKVD